MHNDREDENKRLTQILEEVYKTIDDRMMTVQNLGIKYEDSIRDFQARLIDHIKSKCKNEFEAIDRLGKVSYEEEQSKPGPKISNRELLSNWEDCSEVNDLGFKEFFLKVDKEKKEYQKVKEKCLSNCLDVKGKSDKEIKNCFITCFNNHLDYSEKSMKTIIGKIDELDKKI